MSISTTLESCLESKSGQYEIFHHSHTANSMATAEAAHIPGDRLAKTVILEDDIGYAAAVLPSTRHLSLTDMWKQTGRRLQLASEDDVRELFKDCELGALPPVAMAYGMPTYLDESLVHEPDVYFEAGDHEALIHMRSEQFLDLMQDSRRISCAHRM